MIEKPSKFVWKAFLIIIDSEKQKSIDKLKGYAVSLWKRLEVGN
jgi:hypothetical protein